MRIFRNKIKNQYITEKSLSKRKLIKEKNTLIIENERLTNIIKDKLYDNFCNYVSLVEKCETYKNDYEKAITKIKEMKKEAKLQQENNKKTKGKGNK